MRPFLKKAELERMNREDDSTIPMDVVDEILEVSSIPKTSVGMWGLGCEKNKNISLDETLEYSLSSILEDDITEDDNDDDAMVTLCKKYSGMRI